MYMRERESSNTNYHCTIMQIVDEQLNQPEVVLPEDVEEEEPEEETRPGT